MGERQTSRLVEVCHFSHATLDDLDALKRAAGQFVTSDLVACRSRRPSRPAA